MKRKMTFAVIGLMMALAMAFHVTSSRAASNLFQQLQQMRAGLPLVRY